MRFAGPNSVLKTNNLILAYIAYVLAWDTTAVALLPVMPLPPSGIWQPMVVAMMNALALAAVLNLLSRFPVKPVEATVILVVSGAVMLVVHFLWPDAFSGHIISTLPMASIALLQLIRIWAPKSWNLQGRDCDANGSGR